MDNLSTSQLVRLVRDAGSTRNAMREVLYALALRANPKRGYICWPSYAQLALDTCLNEDTVRRATVALDKENLVRRVYRANRSNCFYINVQLLQEQADARKEQLAQRTITQDPPNPFATPDAADAPDASDNSWMVTGGAR
jgi:hypothetical protein